MATSFPSKRPEDFPAAGQVCSFNPSAGQTKGDRIRIVIADNPPVRGEGLRNLIGSQPGLWVEGESSVGAEVARLVRELKSDTLLIVAPRRFTPSPSERAKPAGRPDFGLTPRELEITRRVADGSSNKEMGKEFNISLRTVKHHLTNIFDKLGICSRLQLAIFAIEHGLARHAED